VNRPRVLLAEDHALLRAEVEKLLARECELVAVVVRGDELLARATEVRPDVMIVDISLPGRSGLQALPSLRAALPDAHIVMLTAHDDPLYREEALRRGADEYVVKWHASAELMPAIHRARGPARATGGA
jgi:DNA-binding NarL/FixJ family response regulator